MSYLADVVRAMALMSNTTEFEPIMVCKTCGYRASFGLMRPAIRYPGNVRCAECGGDNVVAEPRL